MKIIAWIDRRLPGDHRLHIIVCVLIATAAAHVGSWFSIPPWVSALAATVAVGGGYELRQRKTGKGHASWNDMGANLAGGALVALATLA